MVRRRVWVVKDSPRSTAGELQKIVASLGQKNQTAPTLPHVVREGFKKNCPSSSKNKLQHIQLSDTTVTSNGTGFYGQIKQKICLLAANTQDGFGEHMDSIKYQQIQNLKVTDCVRNLIMGHVWIFQPYNNQNTNLKKQHKNESLSTKPSFCYGHSSPLTWSL